MISSDTDHFLKSDRALEENIPILISDASLLYQRFFNRQVKDLGLTVAQWNVLSFIYRWQGLTQTELADLLGTGKSPLGKKIDSLEEKGLVERRNDANDRRVKRIYMATKLDTLEEKVKSVIEEMVQMAVDGISDSELEQARHWLRIMIANLTKALSSDVERDNL